MARHNGNGHEPATVEQLGHLFDRQSERILLANVLHRGEEFYALMAGKISPEDFAGEQNRRLLETINEAHQSGRPVDRAAIALWLHERDQLAPLGGLTWLLDFDADYAPLVPAVTDGFCRLLRRKAIDRQAWQTTHQMALHADQGFSDHTDEIHLAQERLKTLEAGLVSATEPGTVGGRVRAMDGGLDGIFARPKGVVPTPWSYLNQNLNGGFQRGQFILLAARPSVGKTAMALQLAVHAASKGIRTAFFSLEMGYEELLKRLISFVGSVNYTDVICGTMSQDQRALARMALNKVDEYPLEIYDNRTDLKDILGVLSAHRNGRYGLGVIDYLGLIETGRRFESRNVEVSHISRRLKLTARELNLPLLALSQLSRDSDKDNRAPRPSDLRDSGSLEQDSDTILMLHQPGGMRKPGNVSPDSVELRIEKQRNGPRQVVAYFVFRKHYVSFQPATRREEEEVA